MKLELVTRTDVSFVELVKDETECLGITIKVGTEEEAGPVIKKVKPRSTAERSLSVAEGDVILFLNGRSTACKGSKDIHLMLKDAGSYLDLQLQYILRETRISRGGVYRRQILTVVLQKENGSFGFILRKKGSEQRSFCVEYPVISNIKEGSQAQRSGQLQEGDRLLKVDDLSLSCLSLAEIACILQNRNRAEFTFEYGIRVSNLNERRVESTESSCKLDLEIDVPVSDLGVSLNTDESVKIHIGSIRRGSIAERCGVLSEGDVILSINHIETKSLTLAKADYLLRNVQQVRKISFIPGTQLELNATLSTEVLSDMPMEEDITTAYSSTTGAKTTWKHLNTTTPVSSYNAYLMEQRYLSPYNQTEDIKTVDQFQHTASIMIRLKRALSLLTREAYVQKHRTLNQNCTVCDKARHSVKLCASCVASINVECAQSLNSLRDIVTHFVGVTTNPSGICYQSAVQKEQCVEDCSKLSTRSLIHILKEKIPRIFDDATEVKESFNVLAEKIERAETTCGNCSFDVKSVMAIVKKLLLLESLGDDSLEMKHLLKILKRRLLEAKFICEFEADECIGTEEEDEYLSTSANFSENALSNIEGQTNSPTEELQENNSGAPSRKVRNSVQSSFNISPFDTSTNMDYWKIAHIENLVTAENSVSLPEISAYSVSTSEKDVTESQSMISRNSLSSINSGCLESDKHKKLRRSKYLKLSQRVRKKFRSFFSSKNTASTQRVIPLRYQSTPVRSNETDTDEATKEARVMPTINKQNYLSANPNHVEVVRSASGYRRNSTTTSSSVRTDSGDASSDGYQDVHTETIEVKMTNEGDGFGLGIILKVANEKHPVFVISAIRRKSPSHKTGILKEDDRIVAINHQKTSGLGIKELRSLKTAAFSAETVTLTVEFDVVDRPKKFGTFDVHLNKTPKPGLLFREKKVGHPMIVSGVLKGGMAHRCGQIFKGDKIMFFKLTKVEKFDPVPGIHSREEKLTLTVQRDPPGVSYPQPAIESTFASYFNPCFQCEDDVPRNGPNYIVKKSAVRALRNADALVLEHEVTLFRDPILCDFGMLVGEDTDTGRAYVTDVRPNGPADHSGVIRRFDRIVQVNSIRVDHSMEDSILTLLSKAEHKVDLRIRRIYHEETTRL